MFIAQLEFSLKTEINKYKYKDLLFVGHLKIIIKKILLLEIQIFISHYIRKLLIKKIV
jgi:hypothetical protein